MLKSELTAIPLLTFWKLEVEDVDILSVAFKELVVLSKGGEKGVARYTLQFSFLTISYLPFLTSETFPDHEHAESCVFYL